MAHLTWVLGERAYWPSRHTSHQCDELASPHTRPLFRRIVTAQLAILEGPSDVRFGSKPDICSAPSHVRFTPESRHVRHKHECPLRARSGGMYCSKSCSWRLTTHNSLWTATAAAFG